MSLKNAFSHEGRYNRAKYWGYSILLGFIVAPILWVILYLIMNFPDFANILWWLYGLFYIIFVYISFMILVKRLHDLDKNGWMSLLALIPFVNIYIFIICGFFKGTTWNNQYGADPLAETTKNAL